MASVFKPKGKEKYVILYTDESGRRRKKTGATDKAVTRRSPGSWRTAAALRREGLDPPGRRACAAHEARPLSAHLDDFERDLSAKGATDKHAKLFTDRARRVAALVAGAKLEAIDPPRRAARAERGASLRP